MGLRTLEVAVIGAGIAGLYAAWRLRKGGIAPSDLGLFEATSRIGGRVLTVTPPSEISSMNLDLGAHVIAEHHVRTRKLVRRLGLGHSSIQIG